MANHWRKGSTINLFFSVLTSCSSPFLTLCHWTITEILLLLFVRTRQRSVFSSCLLVDLNVGNVEMNITSTSALLLLQIVSASATWPTCVTVMVAVGVWGGCQGFFASKRVNIVHHEAQKSSCNIFVCVHPPPCLCLIQTTCSSSSDSSSNNAGVW